MKRPTLSVLLLALSLAACATDPAARDADRLALYRANAGEPVPSFRYFGRINGWTPLGGEAVALWTRPNEAWLLSLRGPCPDLDFARAIQVTHQLNTVNARFDKVVPLGGGVQGRIPCFIEEIRPLDVAGIREAERARREGVEAVERAD